MHIRRSFVSTIGVSLIAVTVAIGYWFVRGNPEKAPQYSLAKVTRGDIVSTVSTTGTLSPMNTVQVGSQVSGTIQRLYVDFNSQVKKGDLIAEIDPALFKARLAEADATLASAKAARDKAAVGISDAKQRLDRLTGMQKNNIISASDIEEAKFALEIANAEHQVKQAAIAQAAAAREREKVNLTYTSIYTPINGVVISRNVDVGQTVAASLQAPTLFTIAQDLTRMQIETEVDEAFIGSLKDNQPVSFTVFAYQQRKFQGRVSQIRLNPKVEAGVVKYNCIIHVENDDFSLKPGMTATVLIEIGRSENTLIVPNGALRFVPDIPPAQLNQLRAGMKSNEGFIWSVRANELIPIKVTTGLVGEKETEITAANIAEDMPIALAPKRQENDKRRGYGLSLF